MGSLFVRKMEVGESPGQEGRPAFLPDDDEAKDLMHKIKDGTVIMVTYKRARSPQHHRLLFALLKKVADNMTDVTVDELLDSLKVRTGHCQWIELRNGERVGIPKSISFANMGQDKFKVFFEAVLDVVVRDLLPGINKDALREEVYNMVGINDGR